MIIIEKYCFLVVTSGTQKMGKDINFSFLFYTACCSILILEYDIASKYKSMYLFSYILSAF